MMEGYSFQEDRLSKVKAVLLLTKVFHSTSGCKKAQGDHNLEKRYLRGPMMMALAPGCSKMTWGQRTREVTPFRRAKVMAQTTVGQVQTLMKCLDWDSMVGESVPGILTKETRCEKRVEVFPLGPRGKWS